MPIIKGLILLAAVEWGTNPIDYCQNVYIIVDWNRRGVQGLTGGDTLCPQPHCESRHSLLVSIIRRAA